MLDTISIGVLCHPHSPSTPLAHTTGVMKATTVAIPSSQDQVVEQVTRTATTTTGEPPAVGSIVPASHPPPSYTSYTYPGAPYLQVIQLVEVPAPPPRPRDAWESRYSSSYTSSSSESESSSSDSYVDSYCSSSEKMMEDDGAIGGGDGLEEMDTRADGEGESIDGTAGVLDEECDRFRLGRVHAWLSNVELDCDAIYGIRKHASSSSLSRIRLPTNYTCSACDQEFAGLDGFIGLRAHAGGEEEEACRSAVGYALEPSSPPSPTVMHMAA